MRFLSRRRSRPARREDDRARLASAAAGDPEALETLYRAHVDGLYAFVFYRVGRDSALAEDAVQETFARALDRIEDFDPDRGSIAAWLCSLSRNAIRDQLRAHRRSDELAARWERIDRDLAAIFDALDREPLTDEVIERAETRDIVNMTFANLPERYRAVLRRKYIDGDSLAAMAAELAMTEDAAKSLLARARRAFRETFATVSRSLAEAPR